MEAQLLHFQNCLTNAQHINLDMNMASVFIWKVFYYYFECFHFGVSEDSENYPFIHTLQGKHTTAPK